MDNEALIAMTRSKFACEWLPGVPEFQCEPVRALAKHWLALYDEANASVPYRRQINPALISESLSKLYIYQRVEDQFVCRLAGEDISWNYDKRLKGRALSELLTPPIYEMVGLFMTTCLEVPAIYRNFGTLYSDTEKRWGAGERVFLPCRSDDGQVDCVIGVTVLDASEAVPGVPTRSFFRCGPTAAPIS